MSFVSHSTKLLNMRRGLWELPIYSWLARSIVNNLGLKIVI